MELLDIAIIGLGPAGIGAGIYAVRGGLKTKAFDMGIPGGQILNTELVDNYPGFRSISGPELAGKLEEHAKELGLEMLMERISSIRLDGKYRILKGDKAEYKAKSVIIATGGTPRKLGIPGEAELAGRGVSYCAVCDGPFFRGKNVAVIGGGDAAVEESVYLSKIASSVTIIHRRGELRASKAVQDKAFAKDNISFVWNTVPEAINGEAKVEKLILKNVKTGEKSEIKTEGVFIYIGFLPNTSMFRDILELDAEGHIVVGSGMESSVPGIYAVGDVRAGSFKQIGTSIGDGITAELSIEEYLADNF